LEIDETVPSSTWFIAPASSKSHTVSPVWKYFAYFDVGHHPGMKYFRICLICHEKQIQKKVNCTKYYSPTPLVNHLRQAHKEQYEEYLILAEERKKKSEVATAVSSMTFKHENNKRAFSNHINHERKVQPPICKMDS
jgi:hypothetical protein